ncbi:hypothetical protein CWI75_14145 [Kineobactrum sediminis]|uniref:PilC beta-propeller domain-containing protein n=1 Tax=Kineobactrum sediminis TaxID=1905677 RepID=A0A2N5XZN4_9GAMM|nr:hypothetical protein [Kineobactrum sediminis]PLW81610.1 hypothetical protein CWI75_14145 [Kineobactrum sediminis]
MNYLQMKKVGLALLGLALSIVVSAEDIDIFAGTSDTGSAALPNVVFVLDNSANWSRIGQQWPDGTQGESEARAIKAALSNMIGKINVGLMMYGTTGGSSSDKDGAYTRIDVQELTQDYFDNVVAPALTRIEDNIESSDEKRDSSNPYGYLPYDLYNYLKGDNQSKNGIGTPANLADANAYTSQWNTFSSPLSSTDICADTYMIFIGNNTNGSIAGDDTANTNALKAAYAEAGLTAPNALAGESGAPLPMPEFITVETEEEVCSDEQTVASYDFTSAACYRSNQLGDCAVDECPAGASNCSCSSPAVSSGCKNNRLKYTVNVPAQVIPPTCQDVTVTEIQASGEFDTSSGISYNMDDWSKFLFNVGVPYTFNEDLDGDGIYEAHNQRVKVITYTVDVFNKQQQADLSGLWFSAANAGGGQYFQAKSEEAILKALEISLGDIVAKASSFAAVTLPLSTTNRTQVENEVYIGMFRPELGKAPRWYGNLKRYQLALFNGVAELADADFTQAINSQTGFPRDCAKSLWTEDTIDYWESLGINPPVASACGTAIEASREYSDLPDGPFVEKGGVGQRIRLLASGAARNLYTVNSAGAIIDLFDEAASFGGTDIFDFMAGDLQGANEAAYLGDTLARPSVHGDVVHSRPLSIRYDDDTVIIFYGANDGLFRAVDASNGSERWGFVAPEHYGKLQRLYDDDPVIAFEGVLVDAEDPDAEPKDYFFDGPTGLHVKYDDPVDPADSGVGELDYAYIFPTMRRGGRMVYGFDVTIPDSPLFLWKQGCDDAGNCTGTDFASLGQTWSTPQGVFIAEYPGNDADPAPVIIFGGGYDACLDIDQAAYPTECDSAKGKGVYVLDALSGARLKWFPTDAPVMSDIATVDINVDGVIELAYVADVKGNLYRIRFADYVQSLVGLTTIPDGVIVDREQGDWRIEKIASMPGNTRRFYNSPTASPLPTNGQIAVAIGTGDRERPLESNYPYTADVQNRFYALIEEPYLDWQEEEDSTTGSWERTVVDLEGEDMHQIGTPFPDGENLQNFKGWWLDLPNQGEQVANPAVVGGGRVFFNTFQPGGAPGDICGSPIGIGRGYAVDFFNPEVPTGQEIDGGGIPIPPIVVTVRIPEGCTATDCSNYEPVCETPPCGEVRTGIIGWDGFSFEQLDPAINPQIRRVFFTEDLERQ